MTKIIGLTGGIGSGKTTIAHYFESLGVPVYIADEQAKKVMQLPETTQKLKKIFGKLIFDNDVLNRQKLATIVFDDKKQLDKLNSIVHPEVKKDFKLWLKNHSKYLFVVKESAILFESKNDKECEIVITVTTPIEIRIKRLLLRDNTTIEAIQNRMNHQWSDKERIAKSDYVIENTDLNLAKRQVDEILKKIAII